MAAIGLPLLLVLLLEGGLRLAGYGHPTRYLIPDEKPGWYRTNPDFLKLFLADNFDLQPLNFRISARKAPGVVRVVILGESAAQGIPAPAFGFVAQLRAQLLEGLPGKNVEVINTGIAAINSHIVLQVARDLADFEPDLFVVYMGNNEVVGPYGPGCTYLPAMPPRWVIRLSVFVHSTRSGQLLRNLLGTLSAHGRETGKPAADMEMFAAQATPSGNPGLEAVRRNFEANLTDIIHAARGAGARTVVCTLASNLKDCAPLLSRHRAGLSGTELEAWRRTFERGLVRWRMGDNEAARSDLEAARRADPEYAETYFLLGKLAMQAGDPSMARQDFLEAIRRNALGFRPGLMLNETIRNVARREAGVELIDTALLLGSDPASAPPPPGAELFLDHVHFTWAGNYQLGRALAERTAILLPGRHAEPLVGLDSAACAAAVGYTPTALASVLSLAEIVIQSPPFTNQLTHCEDLARLERNLSLAKACVADTGAMAASLRSVRAAETRDPGNPYLLEIEENLASSLGQPDAALTAAAARRRILPDTPALATGEAFRQLQAGHPKESLALLEETAVRCPPGELAKMGPAFAEYYIRTRQIAAGLRRLDALFAHAPRRDLHLLRASVLKSGEDLRAAEKEFREALAENPSDQGALEGLVALLHEDGRASDAGKATLAAVGPQPRNHRNNLRAAQIQKSRGQGAEVIRLLLAAEKSGPVNAEIEMDLALHLAASQRLNEALLHLALARQLALLEENRDAVEAIDSLLRRLRGGNGGPP